jgi:hypothetical protein
MLMLSQALSCCECRGDDDSKLAFEYYNNFIHVQQCLKWFDKLCTQLQGSAGQTSHNAELVVVKDELGRFRIWSANVAAHHKGSRSLDFRLRDASHIRERVISLLKDLAEALEDGETANGGVLRNAYNLQGFDIARGAKVPWDELSGSDSDSEYGFDSTHPGTEDSMPQVEPIQDETEMGQLLSGIIDTITCLLRLSMANRSPAMLYESLQSASLDTSHFEQYYVRHVQDKFPKCEPYLAQRLGRALSRRRQYLNYRKAHHDKLASGLSTLDSGGTDDTTVATSIPLVLKNGELQDSLETVEEEDELSQTSYASTTTGSTTLLPPPMPKEAHEGKPFECPFCFTILMISNTYSWRYVEHKT